MTILRGANREEYLCVQMIKIHLLSRMPSETMAYWIEKYPITQYSMTKYEADLLSHINRFHSNGCLSNNNNNQLDYSRFQLASLTSLQSFSKFHQIIYSNAQLNPSNQYWISSHLSPTNTKTIPGNFFFYIFKKSNSLLFRRFICSDLR